MRPPAPAEYKQFLYIRSYKNVSGDKLTISFLSIELEATFDPT